MPLSPQPRADTLRQGSATVPLILGLGFGDEGKGAWVDALARALDARLVFRFNGGPQAAHRVVTPEGAVHIFSQLGAGSFHPGCRTLLSRWVAVAPLALGEEARVFAVTASRIGAVVTEDAVLERVSIDPRSPVVTPWHALLNQIEEVLRGSSRHGSCGRGVGIALLDAEITSRPTIHFNQLLDPIQLKRALKFQAMTLIDRAEQRIQAAGLELAKASGALERLEQMKGFLEAGALEERVVRLQTLASKVRCEEDTQVLQQVLEAGQQVIGEGAQGVLLDRADGFWPYVTPSFTTARQARSLLKEVPGCPASPQGLGVTRVWQTRHGAGPLPSESEVLTRLLPDAANGLNLWQGGFRAGALDHVLLQYALRICAREEGGEVQGLLLSGLDRLAGWSTVPRASTWEGAWVPQVLSTQGLEPAALLQARAGQTRMVEEAVARQEDAPGWCLEELPLDPTGHPIGPHLRTWLEALQARAGVPILGLGWGESCQQRYWAPGSVLGPC